MAFSEYRPGTTFPGRVGRTTDESTPGWPQPVRAVPGSPNVLFIVLDDTGFGQLGCYGSPIATPHLDSLAAGGLRYNRMHTTALCSPSRSCVITGRNHHSNGMAAITELATGYPGYDGNIPFENGFLSEMLQQHGYNTYMIGKWHLMPSEQESAAGPYDRWPLGRGFDRFYGFLGGDTSQWYPELVYDNHQVEPPRSPAEGYHLTEDLADHAISFIADAKQVAPDKPFFLHFCTGATHAPHHVAKEWADRYAGRFDEGWDAYRREVFARQKELGVIPADAELSRHDPDVPEWETLSSDARRLATRLMEVYAGFLSHTDAQIGRLLEFLRETGELDNTLIMVISDNGASAEGGVTGTTNETQFFNNAPESLEDSLAKLDEIGGPTTFNHYPVGLDLGRQHPVPAVEAGNLPRRRERPVPGALARRHRRARRGPPAVRAHHRHGPHGARRARDRTPHQHPRCHAGTAARGELRPYLRRRRRPDAALHAVLRDVRSPGDRPQRLAGGLPVAGALVRRGRCPVRYPDHRRHPGHARRRTLGALPRGRGLLGELRRRRGEPRQGHRADRPVVRRGGPLQRAPHRRQRRDPADDRAPAAHPGADELHVLAGHRDASRRRRAAGAQPPAQHHRRRRHPGGRRRGRVALPGSQQRRFRLLREGPAAALRPQLPQPRDLPACRRRIRCPRAATGCGSSSSPPANRTSPTAEGRRAGPSSTSTINSWPRPTSR